MPHLVSHMTVARDVADKLQHPLLNADRGSYYMGSAGPDMHVLTGRKRHASHFFHLDTFEEQDSVEAFFSANTEIRALSSLEPSTVGFVSGYLTHLLMDELWITDIYRPHFGPASPLGGDSHANILDRVLQYDMDIARRRDRKTMDEIREALFASTLDVRLEFVGGEELPRWREIAADMLTRTPDWDRFRYLAGRFLKDAEIDTEEKLKAFLETVPQLLDEARSHVGAGRIDAFLEKVKELSLPMLERYLQ